MNEFPQNLLQTEKHTIDLLSQTLFDPMTELRADVDTWGVALVRIMESMAPCRFTLSASECDAFVATWLAWKQQQEDRKLAEARRLEKAREDAFEISGACPEISISLVPPHTDVWIVKRGEVIYSTSREEGESYGPLELLDNVKSAKTDHDKEQQTLVDVKKALSIASKVEMLIETPNSIYYHVEFHGDRRSWVKNDELLKTVKDVADQYLQSLLVAHPNIQLVKIDSTEVPAPWRITRDGCEGEDVLQGFSQVLKAIEHYIAEKQEA
jgi:hypothetical protein